MWAAVRPYYANNTTVIGVHICVYMCGEGLYVINIEKHYFTSKSISVYFCIDKVYKDICEYIWIPQDPFVYLCINKAFINILK